MQFLYASIAVLILVNAWAIHGALVRLALAIEAQNRAYGIGVPVALEDATNVPEPGGLPPAERP